MSTDTPPLYLDAGWMRDFYGLTGAEIDRARQALATYRIGGSRYIKVRRDELEAWIESERRTPQERAA